MLEAWGRNDSWSLHFLVKKWTEYTLFEDKLQNVLEFYFEDFIFKIFIFLVQRYQRGSQTTVFLKYISISSKQILKSIPIFSVSNSSICISSATCPLQKKPATYNECRLFCSYMQVLEGLDYWEISHPPILTSAHQCFKDLNGQTLLWNSLQSGS